MQAEKRQKQKQRVEAEKTQRAEEARREYARQEKAAGKKAPPKRQPVISVTLQKRTGPSPTVSLPTIAGKLRNNPAALAEAIVMAEILGPPLSMRDPMRRFL